MSVHLRILSSETGEGNFQLKGPWRSNDPNSSAARSVGWTSVAKVPMMKNKQSKKNGSSSSRMSKTLIRDGTRLIRGKKDSLCTLDSHFLPGLETQTTRKEPLYWYSDTYDTYDTQYKILLSLRYTSFSFLKTWRLSIGGSRDSRVPAIT